MQVTPNGGFVLGNGISEVEWLAEKLWERWWRWHKLKDVQAKRVVNFYEYFNLSRSSRVFCSKMTWNKHENLLEVKVHGWNLEFQSIGIGWMGFKLFVQMMRSWFNKHIFLGEIVCLRLDMTFNNPEQVACWCSGIKRELAKDIFCQQNTIQ